jgi:hypothetical protein|tara:strand:- start:230 stop:2041 length:1812 start_codon:yes stop_codon:yes gene_type:complete
MSVQTTIENYLNYITGSGGGWPTNTNIGIFAGVDYIKEETTGDIYLNEMNTACGVYGTYNDQTASFDLMADYANEKGCTTAYIYGQNDSVKFNPSDFQQPIISSSFARHNISCNFEFEQDTSLTYFSQRGSNDHTDSFHLFMQTPWYSDDTLLNIVSGSFNKDTFRTILNSSPVNSSLIPIFNTGSFSDSNAYHPDFVIKNPAQDGTSYDNSILFHKYVAENNTYQSGVDSGSLIETYIVPSGSTIGTQGYLKSPKYEYLMTPDRQILTKKKDKLVLSIAPKFILSGDRYHMQNALLYSTASGSLIRMYDDSTKQVQDVEVGDVVKSYKPVGMPDEFFFEDWLSYSTTDLSGSTPSGSVVVRTLQEDYYGYYLINDSIKVPVMKQSMMKGARYFLKQGDTWSWAKPTDIDTGDYFLNKDGNEVEITSKTEVAQEETFYSLDVEDIDTYFTSDILVHNIPPGKCFTGDTMITLFDGTYEKIKNITSGMKIKTYNEETGRLQNSVVGDVTKIEHDNLVEYRFDNNTIIKATDDHPFYIAGDSYTDSDYRPLELGDKVLTDDLGKIELMGYKPLNTIETTYNIDNTNNSKNYFANKVLVSDESETE